MQPGCSGLHRTQMKVIFVAHLILTQVQCFLDSTVNLFNFLELKVHLTWPNLKTFKTLFHLQLVYKWVPVEPSWTHAVQGVSTTLKGNVKQQHCCGHSGRVNRITLKATYSYLLTLIFSFVHHFGRTFLVFSGTRQIKKEKKRRKNYNHRNKKEKEKRGQTWWATWSFFCRHSFSRYMEHMTHSLSSHEMVLGEHWRRPWPCLKPPPVEWVSPGHGDTGSDNSLTGLDLRKVLPLHDQGIFWYSALC